MLYERKAKNIINEAKKNPYVENVEIKKVYPKEVDIKVSEKQGIYCVEKDGYKFFMQIDEFYYPENIVKDRFIFSGGALYLYRKNDEIIAGFWQFS